VRGHELLQGEREAHTVNRPANQDLRISTTA
jgi:hypothetical protein